MEAYQQYVDYIMAGGVAETAYILTKEGAICGTNLPIKELPRYEFDLEDDNDPTKTTKVLVDERVNLLDALAHQGVAQSKIGIRLYNQKYYLTAHDAERKTTYFRKVPTPVISGQGWSLCGLCRPVHRHRHLQYRSQHADRSPTKPRRTQQASRKTCTNILPSLIRAQ